jgi:transcriptional regulator with XRE-family HTH domain
MNASLFSCPDCGRSVRLLPAKGEQREFKRGYLMSIPATVEIPKCEGCGAVYFDSENADRVDRLLEKIRLGRQREEMGEILGTLKGRGFTLRQVEQACGVTPTYLSRISKGRSLAGITLMRLLRSFVDAPFLIHNYVTPKGREGNLSGTVQRREVSWIGNLESSSTARGTDEAA